MELYNVPSTGYHHNGFMVTVDYTLAHKWLGSVIGANSKLLHMSKNLMYVGVSPFRALSVQ